jgi:antitoxin component YwqK of YwqJK toxin-antitoxin module
MNQVLIGISLSFIFVNCDRQGSSIKENAQTVRVIADTSKEVEKPIKELVDFNKIDTSIYNQYKDGKKDGLWKEVDKNGVLLSEGYYKNGRANGWMKWYYRGVLTAEGKMINDKRNGPWMICDVDDPSACINAYFENESREGLWKTYHKNGQLQKEQVWENDQPIAEKCWDEKGVSITCE